MKQSLQQKKMSEIFGLLSQDLGHIQGERESGPNGIKKDFLRKSAAFLRQLGKDLGFKQVKVNTNKAGIAVSGEVTLYGMWSEGNGLYFEITQTAFRKNGLLYREIKNINDSSGGFNQWLPLSFFREMDYDRLCDTFLAFKSDEAFREEMFRHAA